MKQCYRKRISNQKKSTKWPSELYDPTHYVDVTVVRAKILPERFHEEHAMGFIEGRDYSYVTVDELLKDGYGEINLIEGDPGSGKTTYAFQICKNWANNKVLKEDLVFWIPLRHYKLVTTISELFAKLGYREMMGYAQRYGGKDLVLMLDGWDELPNQLQKESLFRDIVLGKISEFTHSTIIVTSRPNCSSEIAKAVKETNSYYQILGFDQEMAVKYINDYFHNDPSSAKMLLNFLSSHKYLRQHFYIPISVTIMCFVYYSGGKQIPQTLCRLYEDFVVLCLRSNVPDACLQDLEKFKTIHDIPEKMKSLFDKLCKTAFDMLKDNKLVMHEEEFGVVQDDLDSLQLKHFDGFGLLHIDHYTSTLATTETSYTFIHRAVQELLAAIYIHSFIFDTSNISDIFDKYFDKESYLFNLFPFLFSLVSKELLRPLAKNLIERFMRSNKNEELLSFILYCLFEAHDEELCREFGQVFSEKRDITVTLQTFLDCHYACYFISVCGVKKLNITIRNWIFAESCDLQCEILHKYLQNTSADIASFCFTSHYGIMPSLSQEGMKELVKALSTQLNLESVKLWVRCVPGCITILCDSIRKHNPQINKLALRNVSEKDLKSIGLLLTTCLSIEWLRMSCSPSEGICLDLSPSFCKALCETKSLQKLDYWVLSQVDGKVFGNIISQNCSLKELFIQVATADCLDPILNGLSSNTSITTFKAWPSKTGTSNSLGQYLKKCLTLNKSVNVIDFTAVHLMLSSYVSWSHRQVNIICAGLCDNTTLVTLDISGCDINTKACRAVCDMLSKNKTLQHLFLNPALLEKREAIALINSRRCNPESAIKHLSLVKWPPKFWSGSDRKDSFQYSCDQEITDILQQIQELLNVYWLVAIYIDVLLPNIVCTGNITSIRKLKNRYSHLNSDYSRVQLHE